MKVLKMGIKTTAYPYMVFIRQDFVNLYRVKNVEIVII